MKLANRSPRGFTLIELVSSLFVTSIVVVAMASTIGLMTRALPDASRPTQTGVTVQRALDMIALDARFATEITVGDDNELSIQTADRDSDGTPEVITYQWGGTAGDALTREHNSFGEAPIITAVDSVDFELVSLDDPAQPSHQNLVATIRVGAVRMSIWQRCLNLEID